MLKTREEIEALKADWMDDPCWDLDTTEEFEDYKIELAEFERLQGHIWMLVNKHNENVERVESLEREAHKLEDENETIKEIQGTLKDLQSKLYVHPESEVENDNN